MSMQEAEKYPIQSRLTAIELPCNVLDQQRAIEMLGGQKKLASAIRNSERLELRFRLGDNFSHPINSLISKDQHILMEIKVSRRLLEQNGGSIKQTIRDMYKENPTRHLNIKCHSIHQTYRFREIADFSWCTKNSPFVHKINSSLFAGNLKKIKELELEGPGDITLADIDSIPPPRFSQNLYPYPYYYKQNPMVTLVKDGENTKLINSNQGPKIHSWSLTWNDQAPSGPKAELLVLPSRNNMHNVKTSIPSSPISLENAAEGYSSIHELNISECVEILTKLFEKRPMWIRQGLRYNIISQEHRNVLKFALPYVAYYFRSGPFRGAYVRYGVDPRKDPEMRFYQTESFRINETEEKEKEFESGNEKEKKLELENVKEKDNELGNKSENETKDKLHSLPPTYIFDGTYQPLSQTLQLIDILEPFLKEKIYSAGVKTKCDSQDGWFDSNDIFKIRKALKARIRGTINSENTDEIVERIFAAEDEVHDKEEHEDVEESEEEINVSENPSFHESAVFKSDKLTEKPELAETNFLNLTVGNEFTKIESLRDLTSISKQMVISDNEN